MATYTKKQFEAEYPTDAACLDKVFQMRYGNMKCCPKCGKETEFKRVSTRRSYQCRLCYHQLYPCAGTPFEKTRTPLNYWFYVMYLMTTTRNGVSAKEVERILGVTYKTAFKMTKQIRVLMAGKNNGKGKKLTGHVEMDETYVGGKSVRNGDYTPNDKAPVFAMVERLGDVVAEHIPNTQKTTIDPIIEANVDKEARISTDESPIYTNLNKQGFNNHGSIKHSAKQYRRGDISTNTIEGFFGQLKRMIHGTHIHVSDKHLQKYVDEACFRYNHRQKDVDMFGTLVLRISTFEA
jgi:transposase